MARFGFGGGFYTSQAVTADAQRCVNWIPEAIESEQGKSRMALYPRPGSSVFANLAGMTSVPQGFYASGRRFFVGDNGTIQKLFEVSAAGVVTAPDVGALAGVLGAAGGNVTLCANQASPPQLMITSAGRLFLFNLGTNKLQEIDTTTGAAIQGPVSQVGFDDSFFVVLLSNSSKFQISAPLDGTSWDPLDIAEVSEFPENVVGMIVDHREIVFFGSKKSVAYYNTGNALFPFSPIPGAFIEQGLGAQFSAVQLDNSVFLIHQDERGGLMAWRTQGYSLVRVSTHAIEYEWSTYPTVADAVAYSIQFTGHALWVIWFPTANKTWVYDVVTGLWHEWHFLNQDGSFSAHRSRCHLYDGSRHLVGDWASGNIYQMALPKMSGGIWLYADDFGNAIQRLRRAPHISNEQSWIYHHQLQIDVEPGLGPDPPLQGLSTPTTIVLADATGALWAVQVSDGGILSQTPGAVGTPQTVILNDAALTQSWLLGITVGGLLTTTVATFAMANPQTMSMTSAGGGKTFDLGVTTGGMLQTTGSGIIGREPQIMLRWSDDGGQTWSNQYVMGAGLSGDYKKRAVRRRLGRARDRVYEITCSDPIPWRIVDAYLDATGYQVPTERLARRLGQMA